MPFRSVPRSAPALAPAPAPALFAQQPLRYAAVHLRAADPASLQQIAGQTMGTSWSVRLYNRRFQPLPEIRQSLEAALALVVRQMSHWEPDSDLSRFNRAPAASWHSLAPEFFTVLRCALHWAQASGGAWDPTIAPLVAAWGFGPAGPPCVPDAGTLARARARTDYRRIQLRPARQAGGQALQAGGVQLDLSGIAKGYAVDLLAQRLIAQGQHDFLVEIGGELRASGQRPGGQPWQVAIAPTAQTLALRSGQAIATSGDHWHAFEAGGRRYSHSIDPRSGRPVAHALCSVSVLHPECMHADALATVLTILGPQHGLEFAQRHGIAALLCQRTEQGLMQAMTPKLAEQLT